MNTVVYSPYCGKKTFENNIKLLNWKPWTIKHTNKCYNVMFHLIKHGMSIFTYVWQSYWLSIRLWHELAELSERDDIDRNTAAVQTKTLDKPCSEKSGIPTVHWSKTSCSSVKWKKITHCQNNFKIVDTETNSIHVPLTYLCITTPSSGMAQALQCKVAGFN